MSVMLDVTKNRYLTVKERPPPPRTIQGHKAVVSVVAFFTEDGRRFVTGSWDQTLRIWDMQKGALVGGPFDAHTDSVSTVAVSPDDRRIASAGQRERSILIWDVESKQMVLNPLRHADMVKSSCFSPDGKRLASGSLDGKVCLWDAQTGAFLVALEGHRDWVGCVAFSPDGLKLASGSSDAICVWRTDNSERLLEIDGHQDLIRSVVWSPDGQQLVSATSSSEDKTVKFWDSSNGDQIGQLCTGHTRWINWLSISPDGSVMATASSDSTVRLWSNKTHQQIGEAQHTDMVYCVAISPNGELLVSGDRQGNVWLWSINNILEQHKAEQRSKEDQEGERQRLLTDAVSVYLNDVPLASNAHYRTIIHNKPSGDHESGSNHSSETHEASGSHDQHSLFNVSCLPFVHILITECDRGSFRFSL